MCWPSIWPLMRWQALRNHRGMGLSYEQRPNPDQLLKHVQAEEEQNHRGKLKIFLGYAAGVGKTYAMLEAARQRRDEGTDLVVGYVETHGRAETEALLEGLEVIPRRQVEYRGVTLTEMDLDAVLNRRPALALVDELAHTNAPASRHAKRYLDVAELLGRGIDVYTTLNIQHLESLNDVVAQITGAVVRETIPDKIVDEADVIELVDLPPDELQQRLRDGKVYVPDQASRAIQRFFRLGNLNALREIALRRTAAQVGDQMRAYMQTHAIPGPWPAEERILVCVSPSILAERLIRAARRLADEIAAEWIAIYVETPRHRHLTEWEQDAVAQALHLAEDLGAQTIRIPGRSIAETVIQHARTQNVTRIVVGKPVLPVLIDLLRGSVVDEIIRRSGDIDVHVISSAVAPENVRKTLRLRSQGPWQRYIFSVAAVAACTGLALLGYPYLELTNLIVLYLLAVVLVASRVGRGPALATALLSLAAFDYLFIPPRFTMSVGDVRHIITLIGFLTVALVISAFASQAREQTRAAQQRQAQTAALFNLSRDLSAAGSLQSILNIICVFVSQTFGVRASLLLPEGERLRLATSVPDYPIDEDELAVAEWAFHHGQTAGRGTGTLAAAEGSYLPLKTGLGTVGMLGVAPVQPDQEFTSDQMNLLEASTSLSALAVERVQLADNAREIVLLHETERLQSALLGSISQDLSRPLASIIGALNTLHHDAGHRGASDEVLIIAALDQAERLNRLVTNLLDMTRLEAEAMTVARQTTSVLELVESAIHSVNQHQRHSQIKVRIPADLPTIQMDLSLMTRVLVNLLDNALKYSPSGASIELAARQQNGAVIISVADHGLGIPSDDLNRVFDKFFRVRRPENVAGTGLGLAISRGIVEAHGGRIWAEARPDGGTIVTIALPLP